MPPSQEDEDVSYDVEPHFTNILTNEIIDYILDQIYNKRKLKPICPKLIFKRLLLILATKGTITINYFFQTNRYMRNGRTIISNIQLDFHDKDGK